MNATSAPEPIRLMFEMQRDDNPRLYDDLVRFNKGPKRVNRLRFLAYEGLMSQCWLEQGGAVAPQIQLLRMEANHRIDTQVAKVAQVARQTNQAFDLPDDDGEL